MAHRLKSVKVPVKTESGGNLLGIPSYDRWANSYPILSDQNASILLLFPEKGDDSGVSP